MTQMSHQKKDFRFAELGSPKTIWAIPAAHGEVERLVNLHQQLIRHAQPGERIIYLGNMIGVGPHSRETIDEILSFRRQFLSIPGVKPDDVTYLRGAQEEMLEKLMQLQFATNPRQILDWMMAQGVKPTLQSYQVQADAAHELCGAGVIPLSRWTEGVRTAIHACPGHAQYFSSLRRAAYTDIQNHVDNLLFVHAGLDMSLPLHQQGDRFWWGRDDFQTYSRPYQPFSKVIRGYDHQHRGLHLNCVTATVDDGCGYGGALVCARLAAGEQIEAALRA